MVYFVNVLVTNLTPWAFTASDPATVAAHGYIAGDPQTIPAGGQDAPAIRWEAARSTWTGTQGVSLYKWAPGVEDWKSTIYLGVKMPFVGDNSCAVGLTKSDWYTPTGGSFKPSDELVDLSWNDYGRPIDQWSFWAPDGKKYNLWCTIDQGTQVDAKFHVEPCTDGVDCYKDHYENKKRRRVHAKDMSVE